MRDRRYGKKKYRNYYRNYVGKSSWLWLKILAGAVIAGAVVFLLVRLMMG